MFTGTNKYIGLVSSIEGSGTSRVVLIHFYRVDGNNLWNVFARLMRVGRLGPSPFFEDIWFKVDGTTAARLSIGSDALVSINPAAIRFDGDRIIADGIGCKIEPLAAAASRPDVRDYLRRMKPAIDAAHSAGTITDGDYFRIVPLVPGVRDEERPVSTPTTDGSWTPVPVPVPEAGREYAEDDSYLRIGYVSLRLDNPLQEIEIREMPDYQAIQTLRSRTPIQKGSPRMLQQVILHLTFSGIDSINRGLLPLIRLFRRAPFLPVYNNLLLDHGITALAFGSVQISTLPEFPNSLRATFTCWTFNWQSYFPNVETIDGFDKLFCYPLLQLWIEGRSSPREDAPIPIYQHFRGRWDGRFQLQTISEEWLAKTIEFPLAVGRVESWNRGIEAARDAVRMQEALERENLLGFVAVSNRRSPTDSVRYRLRGDVGAARVHLGDHTVGLVFLRAYSIDAVRSIVDLSKGDLVKVIRGPVGLLERVTISYSTSSPPNYYMSSTPYAVASPYYTVTVPASSIVVSSGAVIIPDGWIDIEPDKFIAQMSADPGSVAQDLAIGTYTFVLNRGAKAIDYLAGLSFEERPSEPGAIRGEDDRPDGLLDLETLVIEQVTASIQNSVVPLQNRSERRPVHQYLGSMATFISIAGTIHADESGRVAKFLERVDDLARRYPGRLDGTPFGGAIFIHNELAQFLGVRFVLPISWSVVSVPGFPDLLRFELGMIEFDPTQRRRENLQDLMRGIEGIHIEGLGPDAKPGVLSVHESLGSRYLRHREVSKRLRAAELYPDLALPTHRQIAKWLDDIKAGRVWDWERNAPQPGYEYLSPLEGGTGWRWTNDGTYRTEGGRVIAIPLPEEFLRLEPPEILDRWADPDFYCAASMPGGEEMVRRWVEAALGSEFRLYDAYGTQVKQLVGRRMETAEVLSDEQRTLEKGRAAGANADIKPLGAEPDGPAMLVDPSGTVSVTATTSGGVIGSPFLLSEITTGRMPTPGSVPPLTSDNIEERRRYYAPIAMRFALANGIPYDVFLALIETESGWRHNARSHAGAQGLGQIMPGTWRSNGGGSLDPYDPVANLMIAAKIFGGLLRTYRRAVAANPSAWKNADPIDLALAAYNAGAGRVNRARGVPNIDETRNYVRKVRGLAPVLAQKFTPHISPDRIVSGLAMLEEEQRIRRLADQISQALDNGRSFPLSSMARWILPMYTEVRTDVPDRYPGESIPIPVAPEGRDPNAYAHAHWFTAYREAIRGGEVALTLRRTHLMDFVRALIMSRAPMPEMVSIKPLPEVYDVVPAPGAGAPYTREQNPVGWAPSDSPPPIEEAFYNPTTGEDIWHDLRKSFDQGRLRQAFPTFYVALIDGGRWLRVWRLYDHIYGMMAVTRISVHRTRKGPVETALVGFSNMYGHLTAQPVELARVQNAVRSINNIGALIGRLRKLIIIDDETISFWSQHINSLMLKPGARLHIRMGFTSDANHLPIVFNGTITEVPLSEGEITVVALSDGIELLNDVPPNTSIAGMPATKISTFTGGGIHPREMFTRFMAPWTVWGRLQHALAQATFPIFYSSARNPYGIEHFGIPIEEFLYIHDGEVGVNLYNPEHSTPYAHSNAWDNTLRIFQFWRWSSNSMLIGINMAGARPWDIFDTVRKTVPDYILYPVPVMFRSTLFFGKGWFPLYGDYKDEIDDLELTTNASYRHPQNYFKRKPFQQVHIAHSSYNLVDTHVRADASNVFTKCQAVGTHRHLWGSYGTESSFLMMVDSDIFDEFQKTRVFDSGLYATTMMKVSEGNLFNSRRLSDHWAASTLKDAVKDMYQGPLVIRGDPWIKPYDFMIVWDELSRLNGPCEVKEVVHTISHETGFVTEVTPDCIVRYLDFEGMDLLTWLQVVGQRLLVSLSAIAVGGALARRMSSALALRGLHKLLKWMQTKAALGADEAGNIAGVTAERFTQMRDELSHRIGRARARFTWFGIRVPRFSGWRPINTTSELNSLLSDITENEDWLKVLDEAPGGTEIKFQAVSRQFSGNTIGRAGPFLRGLPGRAADLLGTLSETLRLRQRELRDAMREYRALRRAHGLGSPRAEIDRIEKLAEEAGGIEKLSELDRKIYDLANKVNGSRLRSFGLRVGRFVTTTARAGIRAFMGAFAVASRPLVGIGLLTLGVNMVIGSISDYIYRWAIARQCLTIIPLRIGRLEYTAGINGHRGSVIGDQPGIVDRIIMEVRDWFGSPTAQMLSLVTTFIPFIGIAGSIAGEIGRMDVDYSRTPSAIPMPHPSDIRDPVPSSPDRHE